MVPEEHLSVDHEEVVHTTEELPPPQANVGHVEQYALTVEVSDGLVEIEDLAPTLWLPTEDIAIVQNCHSTAGYNLLAVVDETVPVGLGGSSNVLSTSSDSVYEDAQDQVLIPLVGPAPDVISDSERVTETVPLLSSYTVETDSLPVFGVDETVDSVDENVHHVGHGDEEGLAPLDPPAEVLVAPIA